MFILFFVACFLLLIDTTTQWLKPLHVWVAEVTVPVYSAAMLLSWFDEAAEDVAGVANFQKENELQKTELLILKGRLQLMAGLIAENDRLRNLMNASDLLKHSVLVAELIGISPDPLSHTIIINRGKDYKVFKGQAVLDSDGLMGQVMEVYRSSSKVLLISDSSHALPVRVLRNGMRFIAEGEGSYKKLNLRYVNPNADIKVGDQLVSSGLGKRYPSGYPVGTVVSIDALIDNLYLKVSLEPSARIDRSRYLLLVSETVEKFGAEEDAK
ncbi:MAG: rod shape-determining protein MreC [Saprospiraceae bacterium]|jgi:rod shape-determining protein MreC